MPQCRALCFLVFVAFLMADCLSSIPSHAGEIKKVQLVVPGCI